MTEETVDLRQTPLRDLHRLLHGLPRETNRTAWRLTNPAGAHALAVGLEAPLHVCIEGHAGYYAAGMNNGAVVRIDGNAGPGVAENMMAGEVHVAGDASQSAGATAHGGLLVIGGNAGARCGISLKGADIVVRGSVGHFTAFMAQAGTIVVCGNAGDALGDSLYEAEIFVAGTVASLGADCEEKPMTDASHAVVRNLLQRAGMDGIVAEGFRRYGSARRLYHFHVDHADSY